MRCGRFDGVDVAARPSSASPTTRSTPHRRRRRVDARDRRCDRPPAGVQRAADGTRGGDWSSRASRGSPSARRSRRSRRPGCSCPCGKASYPSVRTNSRVPAVVAGCAQIALVVPADPRAAWRGRPGGARRVPQARHHVTCSASTGRRASPRSASARRAIPAVRKVVGPGSPAVTLAQVEMQRYGVATMMLLGPDRECRDRRRHAPTRCGSPPTC